MAIWRIEGAIFAFFVGLCSAAQETDKVIAEVHSYANKERPLENPKLFEGDIFPVHGNLSYNAISNDHQLWPGNVIPYVIDYSLQGISGQIKSAIEEYHQKTCLRFQEHRGERNYVRIFNGEGCYANVGMVGGEQPLSLGHGCHYHGTIVHELGHVAGFYHEHTRSDRDEYIALYLHNVDSQYYPQFQKLHASENRLYNRFDYDSVMLYGSRSFSNNGQYSMTRRDGGVLAEVHDKAGLSRADVERVNRLYRCNGVAEGGQGGGGHEPAVEMPIEVSTSVPQWPPMPGYPPQQPSPWHWVIWSADQNNATTNI